MNYKTILKNGSSLIIEKKSKFIGHAFPIANEEQAVRQIDEIRKKHFDARHNVYAYRLQDGQKEKYSDDGEPQKTAGVPIFDLLKKEDITDILIVVTRYFGGTLLGTGGLVRAYSEAATAAVADAGIVKMVLFDVFEVSLDYQYFDRLSLLVKECSGMVENTAFGENITAELAVLPEKVIEFKKAVTEITAGRCAFSADYIHKYKPEQQGETNEK